MALRVLVVGGGGREHAIAWKLAQSPRTAALLCAPGNAGTAEVGENVPVRVTDVESIVAIAGERKIDLAVIGPEEPLAAGIADRLVEVGIPVCGHSATAAQIESSKAFAKEVMLAAGVPTARSVVVHDLVGGLAALADFELPVVIKADGLAAGKGVVVAPNRLEAQHVLTAFLEDRALGQAGQRVVIEECLDGQEVSAFALTDGDTVQTLPAACDYKRVSDNDRGPNTGGMGAYCPPPVVTNDLADQIQRTILEPTVREMRNRGKSLRGVLYAGLMLTANGPKVLEFNARLGDPETQVVLPLLDADLTELFDGIAHRRLADVEPPRALPGAAVGVALASGGYPGPYRTGMPIAGLEAIPDDVLAFHAGTARDDAGHVVTAGGRVLALVGLGNDLAAARDRAYAAVERVSFDGMHARRDIASRELART
ncbi:MAG: phosphoribosylamine--glycine ligase [Thermomicrobiales bacterium]